MRIVILGGAGFIGRNVALELKKRGYDVIVLDKYSDSSSLFESHGISFVSCDYLTGDGIEESICENDCIIHLISTSLPNTSNKDILLDAQNNIIPSLKLFDTCVKKKVAKIIYASSGGQIYGIPEYIPIDEKHDTNPQSAYGIHKLSTEKYLMLYSKLYGLKVSIMRIANPFGPGQLPFRGQGVVSTFIASAYTNKTIEIWGDGTAMRDYIYIDDLSRAFAKMIEYTGDEQIFNIGSGTGTTILDILDNVEKCTGVCIDKKFIDSKSSDVNRNVLNCKKAEKELLWRAETSIYEGIEKMAKYWNFDLNEFVF